MMRFHTITAICLTCCMLSGGFAARAQIQTGTTETNLLFEHFSNENYFNIDNIDHGLYQKLWGLGTAAGLIQYQTYGGGYDPVWDANSVENNARSLYYGVSYSNQLRINGYVSAISSVLDTTGLDSMRLQTPKFRLRIDQFQASGGTVEVSALIEALDTLPWGEYTVFAAVVEREVPTSEGSFYRQHVFRKMLPGIAGDGYPRTWLPGDTVRVDYSAAVAPLSGSAANLGLVLFVQDYATKRIYQSLSTFTSVVPSQFSPKALIQGKIYKDLNANCSDDGEPGLGGWLVRLRNGSRTLYAWASEDDGSFSFAAPAGSYQLECLLPNGYWQTCPAAQVVSAGSGDTLQVRMGAQPLWNGPQLFADLSAPLLRHCSLNRFRISYRNAGSAPAPGSYVDMELDRRLTLDTVGTGWISLGNHRYRMPLGTLLPGAGGSIPFHAFLDCNAALQASHCIQTRISCDSAAIVPPYAPLWDNSDMEVSVECDGDSVRVEFKNRGSGNGLQPLQFFITEDEIMLRTGGNQLPSGSGSLFTLPANGATYYAYSEQPAGHPYGPFTAAVVEGCGAGGAFTPGKALQFPIDDHRPFQDAYCQQNRSGLITNELLALPLGYGSGRFIDRQTPLDYLVHFQNRQSEPAFAVYAEVLLSEHLDLETLELGAASHPYRLEIVGERRLMFIFDQVAVPSYLNDEMGSHGFVQFRLRPRSGLLNGTIIQNAASMYFNYLPPIGVQPVWHQIGERFIATRFASEQFQLREYYVRAYPNPFSQTLTLEIEQPDDYSHLLVRIFDRSGLELRREEVSCSSQIQIDRKELGQGLYFYRVEGDGKLIDAGKIRVE